MKTGARFRRCVERLFAHASTPLALVILVPLAVLLFAEWVLPYFFLYDDNATYFLPSFTYNWQAIVQFGEIPHINFHQALGQTHLGQGQSGVFYIPIYLAYALAQVLGDTRMLIEILGIGHLVGAAVGMYFLLRRHVSSRALQVLGAVTWATFPFVVLLSRSWIIVSFFLAWLPLHMICLERLIEKPTWRSAVAFGAVKAVIFFQGNVQYLIMLVMFDLLYILFCRARVRAWLHAGLGYVFFVLVSAPLSLPMAYSILISADRSVVMSLERALNLSLPISEALKAQVLLFTPEVIFWAGSQMFYVGIPLLGIFLLTLFNRNVVRAISAKTHLLLSLSALLFSTPFAFLLYELPVFDRLRWPFRYFMFFLFFFIIATMLRTASLPKRRYVLAILVLGIILNVYVAVGVSTPQSTLSAIRDEEIPEDILTRVREGGRVFAWRTWLDENNRMSLLGHAKATQYGFDHFAGYDPLISRQNYYTTFQLQHHSVFRHPLTPERVQALNAWNVRWVLIAPIYDTMRALSRDMHVQVRVVTPELLLYENMDALPYARFEHDPTRALPVERNVNSLELSITTEHADTLVISVLPIPFLNVFVDGSRVAVNTGEPEPLRIPVAAGNHSVRVVYQGTLFMIGACLAVGSLVPVGVLWLRERRAKRAYVRDPGS